MSIIDSFDPERVAMINTSDFLTTDHRKLDACIFNFSYKVMDALLEADLLELVDDGTVKSVSNTFPIYVFKGKETLHYTDIDAELYDMENTEVDSVRFILWALTDISRIDALCENYAHIEKVYEAALAANANVRYTTVEG